MGDVSLSGRCRQSGRRPDRGRVCGINYHPHKRVPMTCYVVIDVKTLAPPTVIFGGTMKHCRAWAFEYGRLDCEALNAAERAAHSSKLELITSKVLCLMLQDDVVSLTEPTPAP
jgi:hypothetical protein